MLDRLSGLFFDILLTFLVQALGKWVCFLSVGTNTKFFLLKGKTFFERARERGTNRVWQGALSALPARVSPDQKLLLKRTVKFPGAA